MRCHFFRMGAVSGVEVISEEMEIRFAVKALRSSHSLVWVTPSVMVLFGVKKSASLYFSKMIPIKPKKIVSLESRESMAELSLLTLFNSSRQPMVVLSEIYEERL